MVCSCGGAHEDSSLSETCLTHTSDSAVKQILLTLDERPNQSFIIDDLDEFHVLIRADEEQRVKRELEAEVRSASEPTIFPFS